MKPFDLKAAKAGAQICTRYGEKAKILCTDLHTPRFKIAARIYINRTEECVAAFDERGHSNLFGESPIDLMMED